MRRGIVETLTRAARATYDAPNGGLPHGWRGATAMGCCHYYALTDAGDTAFSVDLSAIVFGPGVLAEVGDHARAVSETGLGGLYATAMS